MDPDTTLNLTRLIISKLTSQEVVVSLVVFVISAFLLWFSMRMSLKRDEVLKEIGSSLTELSVCLAKVIEIQRSDNTSIVSSRDLLRETRESLVKVESLVNQTYANNQSLVREFQEHAKKCIEQAGRLAKI